MKMFKSERFKDDVKYDLLVQPLTCKLDFFAMKPKQAKENFEWWVSNIPTRIEYLINRCSKDLGVSSEKFDFSPESLKLLWKWFLQTMRVEKTPEEEIAEQIEKYGHFGESMISRMRLTLTTEYIICDIAMYLSEVFTRKYKNIKWSYYTKPKRDMFVNQPLLEGFVDIIDDQPYDDVFPPIHMVGVQAVRLFDSRQKETDLYDLFKTWEDWIPII